MNAMIKRAFTRGLSSSVVVLAGLRGRIDSESDAELAGKAASRTPPVPAPTTPVTLNGTIVRSGQRFALLEVDGMLYPLDSTGRAWPFEGEEVRVTGNLDPATSLIHILGIESVTV